MDSSKKSILEATRGRAQFSSHSNSLGAAGFISPYDEDQDAQFLSKPGQTSIVNPGPDGMHNFEIGVAWDNIEVQEAKGFFNWFFKKKIKRAGVDLDLGCLYELQNGKRGAIQGFGEMFGALDQEPYIHLHGDERTGDAEGHDEVIEVSGKHWNDIKRLVIYIYIYKGADNWSAVQPQIQLRVPEQPPMVVSLNAKREHLALCAVGGLENIRGGIKMTNYLEYFPGHAEMDRAYSFGLKWEQGKK